MCEKCNIKRRRLRIESGTDDVFIAWKNASCTARRSKQMYTSSADALTLSSILPSDETIAKTLEITDCVAPEEKEVLPPCL